MSDETPDSRAGYYAVIFSSQRTEQGGGYDETASAMETLAADMPGYIGFETARGPDGFGITVSYWESEAAIANWKKQIDHLAAQRRGRDEWYKDYTVRVAKVTRGYGMKKT